ncbi:MULTISPECIES: GNAT family N-acetyltransferase [unclassified Sphingomonas]|uniref:GNAT family N-acetyltransferase n=1 Tax=unclassified Sphingomonas TaxID=196159 RepID=UPI00226A40AF|nr:MULTISPECIES: GNAT family N-acetyltransferase [unclassified Sphingomonas]
MFARTKRLTLRPFWPEDAAALAPRIAYSEVIGMLAQVPWPYTLADAEGFTARARDAADPCFAILAHETLPQHAAPPTLVGGIAVIDHGEGHELGYWLTPSAWGRGYATEAGHAVVDMVRHALPIERLTGWHFADNPASGRVLRKLGFRDTGRREPRASRGRGGKAEAVVMELDLGDRAPMPMAA